MHEGACDSTVSNAWNCCFFHSSVTTISTKLQRLKVDILAWNKAVFDHVQHHIRMLETDLLNVQKLLFSVDGSRDVSNTRALNEKELDVRVELERWYER